MLMPLLQIVGDIKPPEQLKQYGYNVIGSSSSTGLLGLVSNIIKMIMVVGGLWAFINLILAGLSYVTSGDNPDEIKKANDKMIKSLIGLVIMFGSFTIAGILGYILYGDATAIINPKIYTPN